MSVFGTGSLFGATPATSGANTLSLGNTSSTSPFATATNNNATATTSSSPFGGLGSTTLGASPFATLGLGANNNATNNNTSNTTTAPSLFGGLGGGTTTNTSSASPLAGLGATTNNNNHTSTPSLFGAPAAAAASTTSAPSFASLGASTSLFGNANPHAGPVPPAPSLSLLGAISAAGPDVTAGQPPPTGAYFDSLAARNRQQSNGDTPMEELPSLQLGLGDIRQKLRKLGPGSAVGTGGQSVRASTNGRAHYLLAASGVDPGAAVKDLGAFGATARGGIDRLPQQQQHSSVQAEVDVDTYLSNLQAKTTLGMIQDSLERSARDFDAFLEDNVTMEWEAQRRRIYEHFGIKTKTPAATTGSAGATGTPARDGGGGAFGRSRKRGAAAGGGNGDSMRAGRSTMRASAFERSGMQKSVIGTPSKIGTHKTEFTDVHEAESTSAASSANDRFQREKQARLADTIHALNDERQDGGVYPILTELSKVLAKSSGDRHAEYLADAYEALVHITGEDVSDNGSDRERVFAERYLDLNPNSQGSIEIRKLILKGANRHLEESFMRDLEKALLKSPLDANLGGKPDVVSKIKAYVRLLGARKHLAPDNIELQSVGGEYVWAIVFFLLRSGHVKEAALYVNDNQTQFRTLDRTFPGYLNSYATSSDRRLKRQLQERCNNEYNQRSRNAPENSIDPYRMACYKIIGRCELHNRSFERLNTDVNDWIWLQFNLAREVDRTSEIAGELFGLTEVQNTIREIGQKHFPKNSADETNGGNFGMFFYLQILAGMFEQAIAYLYSFTYVDAVHFAIALEYYGLLRAAPAATTNANELLSHNTRNQPQINFGRMVGYYTKDFRAANVAAAVDYLLLICLNGSDANAGGAIREHAAFCHAALTDLVLETREFSKLIGDIRPDGRRIPGIIESRGKLVGFSNEGNIVRQITLRAASFANDNGRITDAVLLYHLAEDYDSVVQIISRALSEAIAVDVGQDPLKLVPVKPRAQTAGAGVGGVGGTAAPQPGSSLSLAAIDDPVELAKTMMQMYERDQFFRRKVEEAHRVACNMLLQMSDIKESVEAGHWPQALDKIRNLGILPVEAGGDAPTIREYAQRFTYLTQPVAVNVPNLLMWTVVCCTQQREKLLQSQYGTGSSSSNGGGGGGSTSNQSTSRSMADQLKQISVDLITYTSQLRYRFPPHVHEALARASAD